MTVPRAAFLGWVAVFIYGCGVLTPSLALLGHEWAHWSAARAARASEAAHGHSHEHAHSHEHGHDHGHSHSKEQESSDSHTHSHGGSKPHSHSGLLLTLLEVSAESEEPAKRKGSTEFAGRDLPLHLQSPNPTGASVLPVALACPPSLSRLQGPAPSPLEPPPRSTSV